MTLNYFLEIFIAAKIDVSSLSNLHRVTRRLSHGLSLNLKNDRIGKDKFTCLDLKLTVLLDNADPAVECVAVRCWVSVESGYR